MSNPKNQAAYAVRNVRYNAQDQTKMKLINQLFLRKTVSKTPNKKKTVCHKNPKPKSLRTNI